MGYVDLISDCCCRAPPSGSQPLLKVQTVAAAVAAAALLQVSPVSAKVVLEQPQLKKVRDNRRPHGVAGRHTRRMRRCWRRRSDAAPIAFTRPLVLIYPLIGQL